MTRRQATRDLLLWMAASPLVRAQQQDLPPATDRIPVLDDLVNVFEFEPVAIAYDPDFNTKSLRGNVVVRWEYVRGSTLFVVWDMSQADYARPGQFSLFRDLRGTFGGTATNVLMVKASYWFNR